MNGRAVVRHYKYKNIALAMAAMLLIVLAIGSSCRSEKDDEPDKKPAVTTTATKTEPPQEQPTIVPFKAEGLEKNFHYLNVRNAESLHRGDLLLLNSAFKYEGEPQDMESNFKYLYNSAGQRVASASATVNTGTKRTLTAFNEMVSDFYKKTGKATIMLTDIYLKDGGEDKSCYEHESGLAFDVRLYYESEGTFPEFTGTGEYVWFGQNCQKYGLIVRYPQEKEAVTGVSPKADHFRFVGKPHAEIMNENEWCLEEFLDEIKKYTIKEPFSYEDQDGSCWALYYVPKSSDKTTNIPLPLDSLNNEYYYTLSGDNKDGYIVTVNIPTE